MAVRKGVSPLIAVALLIAVAIAVAGLAGPFFSDVIQSSKEGVDKDNRDIVSAADSRISIEEARFNGVKVSGHISNEGQTELENFTVTVKGDTPRQVRVTEKLSPGEITGFEVGSLSSPELVKVSSENLPVSDTVYIDGVGIIQVPESVVLTTGGQLTDLVAQNILRLGVEGENPCLGDLCSDIDPGSSGDPVEVSGDNMTGSLTVNNTLDVECIVSDGYTGAGCEPNETSHFGALRDSNNVMYGQLSTPTVVTNTNTCVGDRC